jgi:hypothetical protein
LEPIHDEEIFYNNVYENMFMHGMFVSIYGTKDEKRIRDNIEQFTIDEINIFNSRWPKSKYRQRMNGMQRTCRERLKLKYELNL